MFKTPEFAFIKVLGKKITIEISGEKCDMLGADGYFNTQSETITLREEYESQERFLVVILHELGHALMQRIGTQFDTQLEEILVHCSSELSGVLISDLIESGVLAPTLDDSDESEDEPECSEEQLELPSIPVCTCGC